MDDPSKPSYAGIYARLRAHFALDDFPLKL